MSKTESVEMDFRDPAQHSLTQLRRYEARVQSLGDIPAYDLLAATDQLVLHGSIHAPLALKKLRRLAGHSEAMVAHVRALERVWGLVQRIPRFAELRGDAGLVEKLYETEGFVFLEGRAHREKLIIVFTTIFNNFQVSNLVLYGLLHSYGVSVLFLKDTSYYHFLRGVKGLGNDLITTADGIERLARSNGISDLFITGYSSGGYASLYMSYLIKCRRYLGFSLLSDLSEQSDIKSSQFFKQELRSEVSPEMLVDLRRIASDRVDGVPRRIYFGKRFPRDVSHALHLAGLNDFELVGLPSGHATIAHLMNENRFEDCLRWLLFGE